MRVLLAEDDALTRLVLETELRGWGYDVTSVADGLAAWKLLEEVPTPLLLLLDWTMPGMDGLQICRNLRERSAEPYVYTLLVTAHSNHEDVIRGLEAGADDYLVKPFDPPELKARLNT